MSPRIVWKNVCLRPKTNDVDLLNTFMDMKVNMRLRTRSQPKSHIREDIKISKVEFYLPINSRLQLKTDKVGLQETNSLRENSFTGQNLEYNCYEF